MSTKCETCVYYSYDEEYDDYICEMDLDEDEMVRFLSARADACPYWRPGDDYRTAFGESAEAYAGIKTDPYLYKKEKTAHRI